MTPPDAALAALEGATEGSEALDRLIYEAMGAEAFFDCTYLDSDMPAFTTSLDAALGLIPSFDGRKWWALGCGTAGVSRAAVRFYGGGLTYQEFQGTAYSPALALCAAAIAARRAAVGGAGA